VLGVIPAHNEAAALASVVADVRAECPDLDLLVVDDGSTDRTGDLLPRLGVRWLQLPERMGVGCAMRAGLRYARRLGYDSVIRLDGDGQHRAQDISLMLDPLRAGQADVVMGSRFLTGLSGHPIRRATHRLLGLCLSWLTQRSVTDPTSGFCALGPRAVRVLAEHHPTGYPEAELRLFLSRNELVSVEVPVESRARMGGKTTLTPGRLVGAAARVLLAMLIVPLRRTAPVKDRE
jgi:glycosyltransferase involved in cell wall biosynthesis